MMWITSSSVVLLVVALQLICALDLLPFLSSDQEAVKAFAQECLIEQKLDHNVLMEILNYRHEKADTKVSKIYGWWN